jgi:Tfp pilus assembly protein PilN
MEDAKACGARLRTIQMAEDLPVILNAYHEKVNSQKRSLIYTINFLVALLLVLAFALYNLYKIQKRLKEARSQLLDYNESLRQSKHDIEQALLEVKKVNRDLKESNQIKQVYITNYMKQFSTGIAKLESYQQMIQKVAHSSNYGKLVQTIKDTQILDNELDVFYQSFDETFLGLFPTFVQDFNALLRPEERLPEPEGGRLSTELRIFALIRLGINDSEEIASFLRYSIKTIYNYRTKIRNKALGDRALLEEQLMGIGITEA